MVFLVATLIVAATAVRLATVAPLRGGLDRALAAAVIGASQIAVSVLIAGTALQALKPGVVVAINAAIGIAVFALTARMKSHVRLSSLRVSPSDIWTAVRPHPWSTLLVATAAVALLWRVFIAYAFPPYTYDTVGYHLPTVAGWLQYEHIGLQHLHIYSASFPANLELLFTWVALFTHSDVWIGAVQVPLAVVGAAAVVGMARLAQVRWPAACAAGALFALSPIVLTQASTNYVDLGVAALFLAGIYFILRAFPSATWNGDDTASTWSPSYLVLAGCAIGLAAGTKATGPLLGVVSVVCLLVGMRVSRRRFGLAAERPVLYVLLLLAPMLALGSFWYVRDWIQYSNPLYPANVSALGVTVFHGTVLVPPSKLPSGSGLSAIVHSWGHDLTRLAQHSSGKWNRADEYEGGMGLVWLLVGLPLLVPLVVSAWKRNRMLFWTFLVPLGLLWAIQPYKWWNRFTIFLLAPALVGVVMFIDRWASRPLRIAAQALVVLCVAVSLWLSSTHVVGWNHVYSARQFFTVAAKPREQRTLGRLFIPELRWVDGIPSKARIAEYLHVSIAKDEFPPFYGLYGREFKHKVFALPATTKDATIKWLDAKSIGYVYVRRPSQQDDWLRADRRFHLLYSNAKVAAYAR
ncbi:MAG: hypothetical protein QOD76_871 [Solirubrobacteraceae bacterium]|nr:hypothetical protein [Solirubrobacteraceae bacterium]